MDKKKGEKGKGGPTIKVGFKINREVWKEVRIMAIHEEIDYQELIVRALHAYLSKGGGK